MTYLLSCPVLAGNLQTGVSQEAQYIKKEVESTWRSLQNTRTLGFADLFDDLEHVAEECGEPDWDSYGASPVLQETIFEAQQFLQSIPVGTPRPTLAAEPDGHVTFEWHVSPNRTLSVSVSPEGELHYSALIGSIVSFGTEPFLGEIHKTILDLIKRVQQT